MTALCRLPVGPTAGVGLGAEDVGQGQAGGADAERADAEEAAARDAVAEAVCLAEDVSMACAVLSRREQVAAAVADRGWDEGIGGSR